MKRAKDSTASPYRHRPHSEPIWRLADQMGVDINLPADIDIKQERWLVAMELAKVAKPDLGTDHLLDKQLRPTGSSIRKRSWHGDGLGGNHYCAHLRPTSIGKQERWAFKVLLGMYEAREVAWPAGSRLHSRAKWRERRQELPWAPRFSA